MKKRIKKPLIFWTKKTLLALCVLALLYILSLIGALSYRYASVTANRSDSAVTDKAQEYATLYIEEGRKNPLRGLYRFFNTSSLKDTLLEEKKIKSISIGWKWFNGLDIFLNLHIPFAFICERNRVIYPSECQVYSKEGSAYATLDAVHTNKNEKEIIYIISQHSFEKSQSLSQNHFSFLVTLAEHIGDIETATFSRHNTYSASFVFKTHAGMEIITNPDEDTDSVISALKIAKKYLTTIEKNESEVKKIHIYDPTRIALWWSS